MIKWMNEWMKQQKNDKWDLLSVLNINERTV